MDRFLLGLSLVMLIACGGEEKECPTVFFAGEIVNPTNDYVVLYKGDVALDSAKLDGNNRFFMALDSVNEGLHHFYHHPELQYVFLERGDSLQIRLNTLEFDESLVFTGRGESINNFLLEMFLVNEQEEEVVYTYYVLEADEFSHKIDSLRGMKLALLEDLKLETDLSEESYELAKASIVYNSYISKEAYPFYHKKKTGEKELHELPEDFYDYRKQINFDDEGLTYLRPYYNFMKYHLGNLSYMGCKKMCVMDDKMMVNNQLHFNSHKLKLIDSLIHQKELRDNLFRNVAVDYLIKCDKEENIKLFIDQFKELSQSNKHMGEIDKLYDGIKKIQPENELPDLMVTDFEGNKMSIRDITQNKKVVFYFWSGVDKGHFKNIHKRISKLKEKYPEYTFVGISMRTDEQRWKSMLDVNELNTAEQYLAEDYEKMAHTLIVYDPFKSVIAKDGVIIDGFANVYYSF